MHLEFQTSFKESDIERFKLYDAALYEQKKRKICTYVVYGADVENAIEKLDHGSIQYTAKAIYMNRHDGDATLAALARKVKGGETLSDDDQLKLVFLPLMKSETADRSYRAVEAVELANQLSDESQRFRLIGTTIAISDKFLDEAYMKKMMEVLKMTRVFRRLYEEGRTEGKQEAIREYLDTRFGSISAGIQNDIKGITSVDVLEVNKTKH